MQSLIARLVELLRIESITGNERAMCDLVESALKRLGNPGARLLRIGNSVVIHSERRSDRPLIALAGHLDTVKGDAFGEKARVDGAKVIGLGASDMKSGVAVMLELLHSGIMQRSPFDLIFVFYDGEEGPDENNGIYDVFQKAPLLTQAALALVLEPTDGVLQLGCMGAIHARVVFRGKRAHSARPWQGENAIYLAQPFLAELAARPALSKSIGGLEFIEVMAVTQARSGDTSRNVVPDEFELNLNMRFCPGDDIAYAKTEIINLIAGRASVEFVDQAPSASVPIENKWLKLLQNRFKLELRPKQAYTDVAVFDAHGVPALNFGPGLTAQAHQAGEYVLIPDLVRCYQIYDQFLSSPEI